MVSVPPRSVDQRLSALAKGNDVRRRRAELKLEIKAGHVSVVEVLNDPPWWLDSMKVWDLVLAQRKFGLVKTGRLFHKTGMSPSKTVAGISGRQRAELVRILSS